MKHESKFDLMDFEGFDWDSGNVGKNEKHDVEPEEAEQIFFNEPLLIVADVKHSKSEKRWHALGRTAKRQLFVVFTVRRKLIRIISARAMNKKERNIYEAQTLRS
jgi:uncharacterized protein